MDDALDGPVLPPCVTHAKVPQWISNYAEEAINSQLSIFSLSTLYFKHSSQNSPF
jgi:hypothetical protein